MADHWREPDQGIWETRGPAQHHVLGKIMSWVAVDRAIRMLGEKAGRVELRDAIRQAVLEQGVDPTGGHLVQAFGTTDPDAALLLAPVVGFPISQSTLQRTVDAIQRRLRSGRQPVATSAFLWSGWPPNP